VVQILTGSHTITGYAIYRFTSSNLDYLKLLAYPAISHTTMSSNPFYHLNNTSSERAEFASNNPFNDLVNKASSSGESSSKRPPPNVGSNNRYAGCDPARFINDGYYPRQGSAIPWYASSQYDGKRAGSSFAALASTVSHNFDDRCPIDEASYTQYYEKRASSGPIDKGKAPIKKRFMNGVATLFGKSKNIDYEVLREYDIVLLLDDSESMEFQYDEDNPKNPIDPVLAATDKRVELQPRWELLKLVLQDIIPIITQVDEDGVDIYFLFYSKKIAGKVIHKFNVKTGADVETLFDKTVKPASSHKGTPIVNRLEQITDDFFERYWANYGKTRFKSKKCT
jgi:hypothetical protein